MSKIKCPNPDHDDRNPSAHVYEDGIYCFSCRYYERGQYEVPKKEKENIEEKIRYIKSLPKKIIRGLQLYSGTEGYYVVWPDSSYYKLRRNEDGPRYVAPKGHKPPLYILGEGKKALVIIEGELNLISLQQSVDLTSYTAVSPGPATQLLEYLDFYLLYHAIFAIVDHDAAGVSAGVSLKRELLKRGKRVDLITCKKDLNQMLQDGGREEVKKWWDENVAL